MAPNPKEGFRVSVEEYIPRLYREIPLWQQVTEEEWNDWHWQLRHRITTLEQLRQVIHVTPEEAEAVEKTRRAFRFAIPPYYAVLMDPEDPSCPVRRQAVPLLAELHASPWDMKDPLAEDEDAPVPHLTHRYLDRVLFLVTDRCAMYCRHCTRRRITGSYDGAISREEISRAIDYIRRTPQVRDVLVSGGDPLDLSDERLEEILAAVRAIPHVEVIRIGTRAPVVLPQRITPQLVAMLRKYHPLWLNTHFNHPKEMTPAAARALAMLADAGIPLGNQTVLLKGINDCPHVMKKLMHLLVKNRVRPYYIYQCDMAEGIEHFRTSVAKGIEIIESLRGHTSGFAVPTFVVDAPGGGGKIPVEPNYVVSMSDREVVLRNFEGVMTVYHEPVDKGSSCHCEACSLPKEQQPQAVGIMKLLQGQAVHLEPEGLERKKRRRQWRAQAGGQTEAPGAAGDPEKRPD